jgi:hypothetical protein
MMAVLSRNLRPKSTLRKLQVNLGDPNTDIPPVGSGYRAAICEDKRHHGRFVRDRESYKAMAFPTSVKARPN